MIAHRFFPLPDNAGFYRDARFWHQYTVCHNVSGAPVSPRARKLAESAGVDPSLAAGTGPNGRIIERDVRQLMRDGAPIQAAQGIHRYAKIDMLEFADGIFPNSVSVQIGVVQDSPGYGEP